MVKSLFEIFDENYKLMILAFFLISLAQLKINPILIIPGDGSNDIEGKLTNRKNTTHWYCAKNNDWYTLWLDLKLLVPGVVDCWADNIKLIYNEEKDEFEN